MLASIDSPQGDQVARTPAAAATASPMTSNRRSRAKVVVRWRFETGMTGADAGVGQLGIDARGVVVPVDVCPRRGGARGPVVRRLRQQSAHRRPVGTRALT